VQSINVVPGVPNTSAGFPSNFREPSSDFGLANYIISGTTRDSTGAALGLCTVHLFRTSDDSEISQVNSTANGLFSVYVAAGVQYYIVAYLPGSPDVAGTTINTLTGTQV
jgi:hypothetical protein